MREFPVPFKEMGLEVSENYQCDGQMKLADYSENKQPTHLSLFTGIAGLDIAAEWAGFKTVGQCEFADYPTRVLERHWPDVPRWRDIRTLTGESFYERTGRRTVDVISGGFPCQPYSIAGKREGKDDYRYLWPEMLRVIRELQPSWVVGENVSGLIRIALAEILSSLKEAGYEARAYSSEARNVGGGGVQRRKDRYCGLVQQQERRSAEGQAISNKWRS